MNKIFLICLFFAIVSSVSLRKTQKQPELLEKQACFYGGYRYTNSDICDHVRSLQYYYGYNGYKETEEAEQAAPNAKETEQETESQLLEKQFGGQTCYDGDGNVVSDWFCKNDSANHHYGHTRPTAWSLKENQQKTESQLLEKQFGQQTCYDQNGNRVSSWLCIIDPSNHNYGHTKPNY